MHIALRITNILYHIFSKKARVNLNFFSGIFTIIHLQQMNFMSFREKFPLMLYFLTEMC